MRILENTKMIPLKKVVSAAMVDSYSDVGRAEQLYSHWAVRGLKKLIQESVPYRTYRQMLKVNKNTNTATLPLNFDYATFVGVIVKGEKLSLTENALLVNQDSIAVEGDVCPKCKQDTSICADLQITETEKIITINGEPYTETTTKKLYADGDYWLEIKTPVLSYEPNMVDEVRAKGGIDFTSMPALNSQVPISIIDSVLGRTVAWNYKVVDTVKADFLTNLVSFINDDSEGYLASVVGGKLQLEAPIGHGASINGTALILDIPNVVITNFSGGVNAVIGDNKVIYVTKKELITNLDLLDCGCPKKSDENIAKIKVCASDVYNCYYTSCCGGCIEESYGQGYNIFEETGLIQLASDFPYDEVYLEYRGFLDKVNGQYVVPQVAFETLVEWIKYKAIQGLKTISTYDKNWQKNNYIIEKKNMERILGRVSLSVIIEAARSLPKFDFNKTNRKFGNVGYSTPATQLPYTTTLSEGQSIVNNNNSITIINSKGYNIATKVDGAVGSPIAGQNTYQNNLLIGAKNIDYILVSNTLETLLAGDFTFDSTTGTITRPSKTWVTNDTLVIPYDK